MLQKDKAVVQTVDLSDQKEAPATPPARYQPLNIIRRTRQAIINDWYGARSLCFGLVLLVITALAITMYYLNHPEVDTSADTINYVNVVNNRILVGHGIVDPLRTPGYPLLITAVFLLFGRNNLQAVSIVQAVLFVLTTLEIYALAIQVLKRTWMAFLVGVLVGINTDLMAFAKAIVVESLTLWLVATLALAVVICIHRLKALHLWLVAALTLAAFMTRPEWVYVPAPLFAYLLIVAARRGRFRRLLPHAIAAVLVIYAFLSLYVYVNGQQNGFPGITFVQRQNLVGKVMEYQMQNEAPPDYAQVAQHVNTFLANHPPDPYQLEGQYPQIADNYWELGGNYADAVVAHHPLEFLVKTLPLFVTSWQNPNVFSHIAPKGPFLLPLLSLNSISADIYPAYQVFPVFALLWLGLLFWKPTRRQRATETMFAVVLLAFYELLMTSLGGYVEFWRLHVPFEPLLLVVIFGTTLQAIPLWGAQVLRWVTIPRRVIWPVWGSVIAVIVVASVGDAIIAGGIPAVLSPASWLVVRQVLGHPARVLVVLVLAGLLTYLSYRAGRLKSIQRAANEAVPLLKE